ncbi:hypothetical protein [Dokdonella sp.]|uniref:hypothetical protein n=1 Tax=Dokdonella sp. TaxID=2291710 RepID=UPI0031C7C542|nr:hypothetical protein [Dokdonella sp.]
MRRFLLPLLSVFTLFAAGCATSLPGDARLGVVDDLAPRVSAAIGSAATQAPAPTVRDDWQLGTVAQQQAVARLSGLGYRAEATHLPAELAATISRGGALRTDFAGVRLDERFASALADWMRTQGLDAVLVLRSLPRALAPGAPVEAGYGVARRGEASLAYANLSLLLVEGAGPTLRAAPQCLATTPVDGAAIAGTRTQAELSPLLPAVREVLRQAIDGVLIRAGVLQGEAACE